ncbi:MAG: NAD-dependent epimerase/dehydratase family protein [Planctomycetota bacterium]|jgi:GDP-L-fucose synthase
MKIYLTGGSGFLGRHLIPRMQERGYEILAPRSKEVDLLNFEQVFGFLKDAKPDAIVHSAAYYGGIGINQSEPANLFYRNTIMAANIIEAACQAGVRRIVPIGSACSYPDIHGDLKESDFWNGRLHDTVEAYGFSKKLQLVGLTAARKQYELSSNHLVLTNIYGEYDEFGEYRSHVLAALVKKFTDAMIENASEVICWGDGSPIREFLYAGDAAEAIVRTIEMGHDPEPTNIGTGTGTTIRELTEMIVEMTGYGGKVTWDTSKPNGVARKVLDISKMKEKLGWEPPTDLQSGLKKTVEWYRENRV